MGKHSLGAKNVSTTNRRIPLLRLFPSQKMFKSSTNSISQRFKDVEINKDLQGGGVGGPHSTVDSILASHPVAPGSIHSIPKDFLMLPSFIDSVHCLDSGQCKKSLIKCLNSEKVGEVKATLQQIIPDSIQKA